MLEELARSEGYMGMEWRPSRPKSPRGGTG